MAFNQARCFGMFGVTYVADAFWQDVLDSRFHGSMKAYTMVNLTVGARFAGKYSAALKITNLFDEEVLQHVFGDIIRRQIVGELRVNLPK